MTPRKLKVGDRSITSVPGEGFPNYYIHADTLRVFKKLVARNRPVRIYKIDEFGQPWYACRFIARNGKYETHHLAVLHGEENWVLVLPR